MAAGRLSLSRRRRGPGFARRGKRAALAAGRMGASGQPAGARASKAGPAQPKAGNAAPPAAKASCGLPVHWQPQLRRGEAGSPPLLEPAERRRAAPSGGLQWAANQKWGSKKRQNLKLAQRTRSFNFESKYHVFLSFEML